MRILTISALLILPILLYFPTSSACTAGSPTLDAAGELYFTDAPGGSKYPVEIDGKGYGVTIDICAWQGTRTYTWQETNGHAGLQTGPQGDCGADTLLATTFTGNHLVCVI